MTLLKAMVCGPRGAIAWARRPDHRRNSMAPCEKFNFQAKVQSAGMGNSGTREEELEDGKAQEH